MCPSKNILRVAECPRLEVMHHDISQAVARLWRQWPPAAVPNLNCAASYPMCPHAQLGARASISKNALLRFL